MKPAYDVVDTYVTDNNGRSLHGILIIEEIDGQGLHETEFFYDSRKHDLWVYGHVPGEIRDVQELLESFHVLLFDKRQENIKQQDVMRDWKQALKATVNFYWRKFSS